MHYDETPETFTSQIVHFVNDFGVNVVGRLLRHHPAHLSWSSKRCRHHAKARDAKLVPAASSIYFNNLTCRMLRLIVGERVNASGQRKS